jgi:hypothetical protein
MMQKANVSHGQPKDGQDGGKEIVTCVRRTRSLYIGWVVCCGDDVDCKKKVMKEQRRSKEKK